MKLNLNRSWLILGLALAVGAVAAFGVHRYLKSRMEDIEARSRTQKMVRVVVPKEDMTKGAVITADAVAVREMPAEWAHSNAITPAQFDRVENQQLAYAASRGEALLWAMLEGQRAPSFSSRLTSGLRAITVPVDEVNSISGMVEPGDSIDLMVTAKKDGKTYMFPLLQNVLILATGTRVAIDSDAKEGRRSFTTVTLEASPQDAQRVLAAREIGKIAALLRAPGDKAVATAAHQDAMNLLGLNDAEPDDDRGTVPVLYGGTEKPRTDRKSKP